jgi:hypothetical protein
MTTTMNKLSKFEMTLSKMNRREAARQAWVAKAKQQPISRRGMWMPDRADQQEIIADAFAYLREMGIERPTMSQVRSQICAEHGIRI